MAWPKGKPRPKPSAPSDYRAANHFKVCAACGEEKDLTRFGYRHWRKGWKRLRASDPEKYADSCKDCTRAKNAVEVDPDFNPDRGRKPGRPNKRWEGHVKPTATQKRKMAAEYKQRVRRRARIACIRYLAKHGCDGCGCKDPRVLEFDHKNPKNKSYTIAMLLSQGYTWSSKRVQQEIRKCRVLCANCHRLHTAEQQGYYAHDEVRSELDRILRSQGIDP